MSESCAPSHVWPIIQHPQNQKQVIENNSVQLRIESNEASKLGRSNGDLQ